jgi:hypothetical protein
VCGGDSHRTLSEYKSETLPPELTCLVQGSYIAVAETEIAQLYNPLLLSVQWSLYSDGLDGRNSNPGRGKYFFFTTSRQPLVSIQSGE